MTIVQPVIQGFMAGDTGLSNSKLGSEVGHGNYVVDSQGSVENQHQLMPPGQSSLVTSQIQATEPSSIQSSISDTSLHASVLVSSKSQDFQSIANPQTPSPAATPQHYVMQPASTDHMLHTVTPTLPPVTSTTLQTELPTHSAGLHVISDTVPPIVHNAFPPPVAHPVVPAVGYPVALPVNQIITPASSSSTDPSSSYQQASDMLATLAASMALHTMSAMGNQQQ